MEWVARKNVDYDMVRDILKNSTLTNQFTNGGPVVQELENYIRNTFQIDEEKAVIVVSNGSVALHVLAQAISIVENIPISWATQSFTFPPSAQSTLSNARIIDIDEEGGLSLQDLEKQQRECGIDANGIIVTNIFGNCVDIDKYTSWANKDENNNNTPRFLIFDNAATSYTFYKGKNCLNYGNGSTLSFHHTKPFGFGEGGTIIVDKKYEGTIRCLNNFGIGLSPDTYWSRYGNNNKMSDVSAAFILQYLYQHFYEITERHQRLYHYFVNNIAQRNIQSFRLFPSFHNSIITPSCFSLLFHSPPTQELIEDLTRQGIICRQYYHPLRPTKTAMKFYFHILCLPCNMDMEEPHIDKILDIVLSHSP